MSARQRFQPKGPDPANAENSQPCSSPKPSRAHGTPSKLGNSTNSPRPTSDDPVAAQNTKQPPLTPKITQSPIRPSTASASLPNTGINKPLNISSLARPASKVNQSEPFRAHAKKNRNSAAATRKGSPTVARGPPTTSNHATSPRPTSPSSPFIFAATSPSQIPRRRATSPVINQTPRYFLKLAEDTHISTDSSHNIQPRAVLDLTDDSQTPDARRSPQASLMFSVQNLMAPDTRYTANAPSSNIFEQAENARRSNLTETYCDAQPRAVLDLTEENQDAYNRGGPRPVYMTTATNIAAPTSDQGIYTSSPEARSPNQGLTPAHTDLINAGDGAPKQHLSDHGAARRPLKRAGKHISRQYFENSVENHLDFPQGAKRYKLDDLAAGPIYTPVVQNQTMTPHPHQLPPHYPSHPAQHQQHDYEYTASRSRSISHPPLRPGDPRAHVYTTPQSRDPELDTGGPATRTHPHALQSFLGHDLDAYVAAHADKYEAAKKRWAECTLAEWQQGADEMSSRFGKMIDLVKEHMSAKMALFATLHGKIAERKNILAAQDDLLQSTKEKLVQDSGNVLSGRG